MSGRRIDLSGQSFGKLKALSRSRTRSDTWICHCACGSFVSRTLGALRRGHAKSCGCYKRKWSKTEKKKLEAARKTSWHARNPEAKGIESKRRRARAAGFATMEDHQASIEARRAAARTAREVAKAERKRLAILRIKPWNIPGSTWAERCALRYRLDPEFNLRERMKTRIKKKMRGQSGRLGCRLRAAIKRDGEVKPNEIIDYTVADLKRHLERQFSKRMNWEKFCAGLIHIDHIQPLASFDLTDIDEARAAWALPNLRPLWKPANLEKAAHRTLLV